MANAQVVKVSGLALIVCVAALGAPLLSMATLTCCDVKPAVDACGCDVKNGAGDSVGENCCSEVRKLRDTVMNCSESRQIACNCILDAARESTDVNPTAFSSLPEKCGVRLPFQFSLNMDCNDL